MADVIMFNTKDTLFHYRRGYSKFQRYVKNMITDEYIVIEFSKSHNIYINAVCKNDELYIFSGTHWCNANIIVNGEIKYVPIYSNLRKPSKSKMKIAKNMYPEFFI